MEIRTAAIVAIGDEVLHGEVVNGNAAWLAEALGNLGVSVVRHSVVGDDLQGIVDAVVAALSGADLLVLSGGLGPTHDDRTSEAVAELAQVPLIVDEEEVERIRARHSATRGREPSVIKQATVVRGARLLENRRGTAPGQLVRYRDHWLALLPGPPRELQAVFEDGVAPWIRENRTGLVGYRRDTLVTYESGESQLYHRLQQLARGQHPLVGIYARPGAVEFRMQGPEDVPAGSLNTLRATAWAEANSPSKLYSGPREPRVNTIIRALIERGLRIAAMESLTGGLFTAGLTSVPGSSQCVEGGVIAYTEEAKQAHGVDRRVIDRYGMVSAQCAKAMAVAVRSRFGADIGVATTGFAGPDGGTEANPVGTFFVAVDNGVTVDIRRRHLSSERVAVRQAVVELAITALWELLELG